jgi:hypothetical protein
MIGFEYKNYAFVSSGIRIDMRNIFKLCKEMMDVSDEELEAYLEERKEMEQGLGESSDEKLVIINKITQKQKELDEAKKKLNL